MSHTPGPWKLVEQVATREQYCTGGYCESEGRSMSRDPRKDPQPGDVLRFDGYTRTVTLVSVYGRTTHVSYHEEANVYGEHNYGESLTNWRRWARKAEVAK